MRRDLKMNSLPYCIQFLIEIIRGNIGGLRWDDKNEIRAHTEKLYMYFKKWEVDTDVRFKTTQMLFSKTINEVQKSERFEIMDDGKKKRAMGFAYNREKLIGQMRAYLNDPLFTVELETEDDDADELTI